VGGKRLRKLAILAAMLATAMLVVAPALAQGGATTEVVTMQGLAYTPSEITVAPGTTVRWVNQEQADHTVTSDEPGGPLDSGVLGEGQSFEYTFETPGTFTYHCEIHPFMTASVTVSSDEGAATGGDASGGSATGGSVAGGGAGGAGGQQPVTVMPNTGGISPVTAGLSAGAILVLAGLTFGFVRRRHSA
jgi:LPXTG-motif cell wall-anchored protein